MGDGSAETGKLLIDLSFARGDDAAARATAQADGPVFSADDRRRVDAALA